MKIALEGNEIKIYDFNGLQAYKIGKHVEEQGIEFYEKLLSVAKDNGLRGAIGFLLSQEKEHLAFFEGEIEALRKIHEDGFEGDDIVDFLDTKIITPYAGNEELENIIKDRKAALQLGMVIEKRSISFYETCVKNTEEPKTRSAFEKIAAEERKHLRMLEELR